MNVQASSWQPVSEPTIVSFGSYRVIGTQYVGKNENNEIPAMWDKVFLPRMKEIKIPDGVHFCFGICRCIPGATDGSFEYIAAVPVTQDAPVPDGMVDASIPFGEYLAIPVRDLSEIHQAWCHSGDWFSDHPEWTGYCNEEGCDCAQHPGFEFYPPEFDGNGPLYIYIPIQPAV